MNEALKNANYIGNNVNKKDILVTDSFQIDSSDLLGTAKALFTLYQQTIATKNSAEEAIDKIQKIFAFLQTSGLDISTLLPDFDGVVFEAPLDGNDYLRNNAKWKKIDPLIEEVPDGNLYLRTLNSWTKYTEPTPESLNVYTKQVIEDKLANLDSQISEYEQKAYEYSQQSLQGAQNVVQFQNDLAELKSEVARILSIIE